MHVRPPPRPRETKGLGHHPRRGGLGLRQPGRGARVRVKRVKFAKEATVRVFERWNLRGMRARVGDGGEKGRVKGCEIRWGRWVRSAGREGGE